VKVSRARRAWFTTVRRRSIPVPMVIPVARVAVVHPAMPVVAVTIKTVAVPVAVMAVPAAMAVGAGMMPRGPTPFGEAGGHVGPGQAWAAGAPLLFIRIMLGLEPAAGGLTVRPHLPAEVSRLVVRGLPGRWGRADAVAVRES